MNQQLKQVESCGHEILLVEAKDVPMNAAIICALSEALLAASVRR